MPSVALCPGPPIQQFNQGGVPLSGGKLFTYISNTVTKLATYTDYTGNTENANPIILDANGQCTIWMQIGLAYTLVLAPADDTDPPSNAFWTINGITSANTFTNGGTMDGSLVVNGVLYASSLQLSYALSVQYGGTGVGSLPAGNLLVGNGVSPVTGLAPGIAGTTIISTGSEWAAQAPQPIAIQINCLSFVTSSTYVPSTWMETAIVEAWGDGGGGGGNTNGTAGSGTSLGTLVVAKGGGGGQEAGPGGAGGTGGTGQVGFAGQAGPSGNMSGNQFAGGLAPWMPTYPGYGQGGSNADDGLEGTGGGGEYRRSVVTIAQVGVSQAVTIGTGGAAGSGGEATAGKQGYLQIIEFGS
jgi:hypothetical protein